MMATVDPLLVVISVPPFRQVHTVPLGAVNGYPSFVPSRWPSVVSQTMSFSIVIMGVEVPGWKMTSRIRMLA